MAERTAVKPVRAGLIGCGVIASRYVPSLAPYSDIELAGVADCLGEKASAFAEKHGLRAYPSVDALLADKSVELTIDLTPATTHAEVVGRCLDAGKHVFTEKPLALEYGRARELVERATAKGLRLGSAPGTFMGEAQQTAARQIREGRLGRVRLVYAEINHGRVESWHPRPKPFYECGLLFDMGPYPLVLLCSIFGPARRVAVMSRVLLPERRTRDGEVFSIERPDFLVALIDFEAGPLARLTICGYADWWKKEGEIVEFHGDDASLFVAHSGRADAEVEFAEFNHLYEAVELARQPVNIDPLTRMEYSRPLIDMARAMREGRPHRASGEMAAHIVEIMDATYRAIDSGVPVDITSTFSPPAPMEWAQAATDS
jgi:predicted dehydrogenase